MSTLSERAYKSRSSAGSWEEIWEAGPYYERLSELLEDASHYAIFAGWQIDSRLPLPVPRRGDRALAFDAPAPETLRAKMARLCESKPGFEVYFLIWDHAYFYCLEREPWQARAWRGVHPRFHLVFDNRHPYGGSHHEKVCVIDGRIALCGGIDLCGDRWDSPQHLHTDPRRSFDGRGERHGPYHDVAVQVSGPVCGEIQRHLANRWRCSSTLPFPQAPVGPGAGRGHCVYVSRTVAAPTGIVREVEFLFRDLIRSAESLILLEGQYYWSKALNDLLIAKIHEKRGRPFRIHLILTEIGRLAWIVRGMAAHQLRLLADLAVAARANDVELYVGRPQALAASENGPPKPIYIHSKVLVVDDRFLAIGSANFANRALRLDTELTLTLEARSEAERAHIRRVTRQILKHWSARHVRLRECKPQDELAALRAGRVSGILARCRWEWFFDPRTPWFHGPKVARRFARAALGLACLGLAATARAPGHVLALTRAHPLSILAATSVAAWTLRTLILRRMQQTSRTRRCPARSCLPYLKD